MYRSPNPYATPEPHFLPGYGGYCPSLSDHCGKTYGHQTHEILKGFKQYSFYFPPEQRGGTYNNPYYQKISNDPSPTYGCSNKAHRQSIESSCCRYQAAPYMERLVSGGPPSGVRAPCCEGHQKAMENIGPPVPVNDDGKGKCYTMMVEPIECSPGHVNCTHTQTKNSAYYLHVCDCFKPSSLVRCS